MRCLFFPAVALALSGCAGAFPVTPIPANLPAVSAATANAWVAMTGPSQHRVLRFHWTYNTDGPSGPGVVDIAPRDSLYLHFAGPLGSSPGSAAVVGDSALWADPADKVNDFVPAYALLWAMVGVARPPAKGWKVEGAEDGGRAVWRYVRGADTVAYVLLKRTPAVLSAYVRLNDKPIGLVTTIIGADGFPVKGRLDVITNPARIDIVFTRNVRQAPFDKELWVAPRSQ